MSSNSIYNGPRVSDTETFIQKANFIHNYFYDYSNTEYINARTKLQIVCPVHGEFIQNPNVHLSNRGCPECGAEKQRQTVKNKKSEDFVKRAKRIHNNFYIYHESEYVKSGESVRITCPYHGDFYQTPDNHYAGKGCDICGEKNRRKNKTSSTEEFIKKAKEVHSQHQYDYSMVDYKKGNLKVWIRCFDHPNKPFLVTPSNHLNGRGCPHCSYEIISSKLQSRWDVIKKKRITLYHVRIFNNITSFEKVGITSREIADRLIELKRDGFQYELLNSIKGNIKDIMKLEETILSKCEETGNRYKIRHLKNTKTGGWTECFPENAINIDQIIYDSLPW